MSRAQNLLEIWDLYSKQIVTEKLNVKKNAKFSTKEGPGPVQLNEPKAGEIGREKETGPVAADNFDGPAYNRDISDLKTMTDKQKKNRPYVKELNVSVENFNKDVEKSTSALINNYMKSTFDKLFEEVMHSEDEMDLNALGVDTEAGDDVEVKDEVTVTLKPEHVKVLKEILAQVEGEAGEEDLGDETTPDDDMGNDEEDAEETHDEDEMHGEATEMEEVPDSKGLGLIKKDNKVHDVTAKHDVGANKAGTTKVKDGVDGEGKDVPNSAGHSLTKISNNKPHSKIKGNNQLAYAVK